MRRAQLSHVGCLVESVDRAAGVTRRLGFTVGEPEIFEGENTKEIYVGDPANYTSTLLLMEAMGPGSYQNAIRKRGPGLHHIAVDVLNLEEYVLGCKGWLLHPNSLRKIARLKTAYFARPGFPAMIEVHGREQLDTANAFLKGLALPLAEAQRALLTVLGVPELEFSSDEKFWASTNAGRFSLNELWA